MKQKGIFFLLFLNKESKEIFFNLKFQIKSLIEHLKDTEMLLFCVSVTKLEF